MAEEEADYRSAEMEAATARRALCAQQEKLKALVARIRAQHKVLLIGPDAQHLSDVLNSFAFTLKGNSEPICSPHGAKFSFKEYPMLEHKSKKERGLTIFKCTGLADIDDQDKATHILQYILEGALIEQHLKMSLFRGHDSVVSQFKDRAVKLEQMFQAVLFVEHDEQSFDKTSRLAKMLTDATQNSKYLRIQKIPVIRLINFENGEPENGEAEESKDEMLEASMSLNAAQGRKLQKALRRSASNGALKLMVNSKALGQQHQQPFENKPLTRAASNGSFRCISPYQYSSNESLAGLPEIMRSVDSYKFEHKYPDEEACELSGSRIITPKLCGPDKAEPKQHLKLLMILNDLLEVLVNPEGDAALQARIDEGAPLTFRSSTCPAKGKKRTRNESWMKFWK